MHVAEMAAVETTVEMEVMAQMATAAVVVGVAMSGRRMMPEMKVNINVPALWSRYPRSIGGEPPEGAPPQCG